MVLFSTDFGAECVAIFKFGGSKEKDAGAPLIMGCHHGGSRQVRPAETELTVEVLGLTCLAVG